MLESVTCKRKKNTYIKCDLALSNVSEGRENWLKIPYIALLKRRLTKLYYHRSNKTVKPFFRYLETSCWVNKCANQDSIKLFSDKF